MKVRRTQRRLSQRAVPLKQGHGGRPPPWRRFTDHIKGYMVCVMVFDKHCKVIIVALSDLWWTRMKPDCRTLCSEKKRTKLAAFNFWFTHRVLQVWARWRCAHCECESDSCEVCSGSANPRTRSGNKRVCLLWSSLNFTRLPRALRF